MDARRWLGLEPTHNPHRWYLPVVEGIASRERFLFGGCALGASICAMEHATGRPVVWATAQYLDYAPVGTTVDLDVTVAVEGHSTTQARVVCHVGGTEIVTVNAALGRRTYPRAEQFAEAPPVRPPHECPPRELVAGAESSLASRLDQRWAIGPHDPPAGPATPGPGRLAIWTRLPDLLEHSSAALAVLGDFVPLALAVTLGDTGTSNSLDNTLRVIDARPTEWFLLDIHVEAVEHGFGHGFVRLFDAERRLLAVGSQSATVRLRRDR